MNLRLKKWAFFCLACFLALSSSCSSPPPRESQPFPDGQELFHFTDDLGREVMVGHTQKAAALIGSFADVWLLAGGQLCAAPNDAWESLSLSLDESVVNLGSIKAPDSEKLLASAPDLVLASTNTQADLELMDLLDQSGITVAYFDVNRFEDYLRMLEICTQITGRDDLYQKNGLDVRAQVELAKARVTGEEKTVLFLRASASMIHAKGSQASVGSAILYDLGCINIADDKESLLDDLSMEAIVAADPDYIFVTTQGYDEQAITANIEATLLSDPVFSSLSAIEAEKFYILDKRLYNLKPNALWGQAYMQLADILYP